MAENTHAMTTPNQRGPLTIEGFRGMVAKQYMKQITNYLGGDEKKSMKFLSAAVYVLQKNPKLLESDPATLIQSLMSCAEFELYPSNVAGEAFIIPYKGKATFQLGYQGLITLLARGGYSVNAQLVRKNDSFTYEEGMNPKLLHTWPPFSSDEQRGDPIGVYAIITDHRGTVVSVAVMSREDVMKIRNLSQAKDSAYSPWNSAQDPFLTMWKKSAIKQAAKFVPKTETLQKALAEDNEESTIQKNPLNAEGPATGAPSHVADDITIVPDPQEELNQALDNEKNGK